MPSNSVTTATIAKEKAAKRLELKCTTLTGHLPWRADDRGIWLDTPRYKPSPTNEEDGECALCEAELEGLEPGDRAGHVCQHVVTGRDRPRGRRIPEVNNVSVATFKKQEDEVIKDIKGLLSEIDERLETFSDRTLELTNLVEEQDAECHDNHLNEWIKYVEWISRRARNFTRELKNSKAVHSEGSIIESESDGAIRSDATDPTGGEDERTEHHEGTFTLGQRTHVIASENSLTAVNLRIAEEAMTSLVEEIEADIACAKSEIEVEEEPLHSVQAAQLKEYCSTIQSKIDTNLKEAVEKVKRLGHKRNTCVDQVFKEKIPAFRTSLRDILAGLRRAASQTPSREGSVCGLPVHDASISTSGVNGYKPYIEKLKLPTFSGKIEEWPEFRAVFVDMMTNVPESARIQYLKSNLPAKDVQQISGLTTMKDAWERLERTYGNVQLNIITVKSNLEKFQPSGGQDHKRVMDVFETVERAVTQLTRLGSGDHITSDLGLIHKLVCKLPRITQGQYAEYLASPIVSASTASDWTKFWEWFQGAYRAAVHSNLIQLSTEEKKGDDMSCRVCGKLGHFARKCPKRQVSSGSSTGTVKVNLSVSQISTRSDYDKGLQEARNKLGSCPCCSGTIHVYKKKFPFGEADWPSRRLSACPGFQSKTPRDRGELIEALQACYVCTSTGHQANACFLKNKSNCTVIVQGKACAANHHQMLHNTGVAYCKKLRVSLAAGTQSTNMHEPV